MSAMLSALEPPRKRLRVKTTPTTADTQLSQGALALDPEATPDTKRKVYLITFPHPQQATSVNGVRLVAPSSVTKAQMVEMILDSFAKWRAANPRTGTGGRPDQKL